MNTKKFHYVYRITNTKLNKHYYGVRTSKIEPSEDLGIIYFSSSSDKEFMIDQIKNPKDYKYKVVMVFNSREDAVQCEIKLHKRFNVGTNESFYNKARQTSIRFNWTGKCSDETREKLRQAHLGNIYCRGKKLTETHKENIRKGMVGKVIMPEWYIEHSRELMKLYRWYYNPIDGNATRMDPNGNIPEGWLPGMGPKNKSECPHCGLIGVNKAVMTRWHFDNCKKKPL